MGQSKIKTDYFTSSMKLDLTGKLKDLKTWVQVKSPKPFKSALNYALDWLAPELLGTGFRMYEVSDFQVKALIPAYKSNLDSQLQIHQGLVTNAALELVKVFIQRQMPNHFFQITETEIQLSKKQKWVDELILTLKTTEEEMDDFFVNLQKFKRAKLEFSIKIGKSDKANLSLTIETTNLIA
jgi:hypothetical protein